MRKTFDLGKIAYDNPNRKTNAVTIEVELRVDNFERPIFTASGNIWNCEHTDIVCGGQCLDEIAKYPIEHRGMFGVIYMMWQKYHLNDMHAGTPEQEKAIAVQEALYGRKLNYKERCDYLESIGLYEVEYHGLEYNGMYKYGHAWLYQPIDEGDLKEILRLLKDE